MIGIGRALLAFLRRDLRTNRSYRFAFVLQLAGIATSLWMYFFLSRTMGNGPSPALAAYGGDLFGFIIVGTAFWGLLSTALTGTLNAVRSEQRGGTMEALLVTTTPAWLLVLGGIGLPLLIGLGQLVLYLAGAALVFHVDWGRADWGAVALLLGLALAHTATLGLLVAALIIVIKRGDGVVALLTGAIALLTGIFYPIEVLPLPLQWLARGLPLTYALRGLRQALFHAGAPGEIGSALLILAGTTVLLGPPAAWLLQRALAHARRDGHLAGF